MAKKESVVSKKVITNKQFSYVNDEVNVHLQFSLSVDTSSELRAYKTLLEMAIKDIDEIIEGMKN